jgi:molecular chaperone DnaK (HSP70)
LKQHSEISDEGLELQGDAQDRFWLNAEGAKIDLSSTQKTNVTVASFFQKHGKIYDLQEPISRENFEALIGQEIDAALRCVERCLKDARLTPGCIDHLLLVGGTSNIPMIRERLEALFGHKVQVAHEPDAAIARGATYPPSVGDTTDTAHCCLYSRVPTRTRLSNPALEDQWRSRIPQKTALTKSRRRLQRISAGISLIILSLGFSLLGLLSLVNKPHADLANVPCAGTASWIAGSAFSLRELRLFRRSSWLTP